MDLDRETFETISPDAEPGMNFISADFELVMVNRANERLYGKSMVALLGKKCYREFEKRNAPCPHCPGRLALATGQAHEAETEGVRDDGSRFAARVRAHPVMGPDNRPTGFIEVVEDITEQKRMESLARIDADLLSALATAQNTRKALREILQAALRVECIDSGCVFLVDHEGVKPSLVVHRNLTPECQEALAARVAEWAAEPGDAADPSRAADRTGAADPNAEPPGAGFSLAGIEGAPRALAVIPILHRGRCVAVMVVGTSVYPAIPPTLRAGLKGLGATAGNAITRIRAEQSRGDAVADLETFIVHAPVAAWTLDAANRITMWNKAAERLFGWKAPELLNGPSPFPDTGPVGQRSLSSAPVTRETSLLAKDGCPVEVQLVVSSFRDVLGCGSTTILMAENLSLGKRVVELEGRLLALGHDPLADPRLEHPGGVAGKASATSPPAPVLVIDADELRARPLIEILTSLGHAAFRCDSVDEAASTLAASTPAAATTAAETEAATEAPPFALAIVDLIAPDRTSAFEEKAALRSLGLTGPVIVSSDSEVRGHEQHGFAAAIRRPYTAQAVGEAVRRALDGGS